MHRAEMMLQVITGSIRACQAVTTEGLTKRRLFPGRGKVSLKQSGQLSRNLSTVIDNGHLLKERDQQSSLCQNCAPMTRIRGRPLPTTSTT